MENNLPAFRITYTDGTGYATSAAAGTTLEEFTAYITQAPHVTENPFNGQEIRRTVAEVKQIR